MPAALHEGMARPCEGGGIPGGLPWASCAHFSSAVSLGSQACLIRHLTAGRGLPTRFSSGGWWGLLRPWHIGSWRFQDPVTYPDPLQQVSIPGCQTHHGGVGPGHPGIRHSVIEQSGGQVFHVGCDGQLTLRDTSHVLEDGCGQRGGEPSAVCLWCHLPRPWPGNS